MLAGYGEARAGCCYEDFLSVMRFNKGRRNRVYQITELRFVAVQFPDIYCHL